VARAIEHEIARQAAVIESGGTVVQETRLWNADRGETAPMRSKEEAQDYRYFPEPDLAPLVVRRPGSPRCAGRCPSCPPRSAPLRGRLRHPGLRRAVLTLSPETAELFEKTARQSGNAKAASNWIMTEVLRKTKDRSEAADEASRAGDRELLADPLAANLAELIRLVDSGAVSRAVAKDVFGKMWSSGERPSAIVEREGVAQISDEAAIEAIVQEVIAASPAQVAAYRGGKEATLGWFVGQVIRKTAGQANPQLVNRLVKKALAG
jgi:aspartyl-tRNA(Asn)/glutamyl-tRNA(Gln) amidotransferase subunit B